MPAARPLLERFWEKINILGPNDCWDWTGALASGCGSFRPKDKAVNAHKFVYILTYGEIDDGRLVMHSCDNRACCNPSHLSLGTYSDNLKDAYLRGRRKPIRNYGENNKSAKLTESDIKVIRASCDSGVHLAKRFGVTGANISAIRKRKAWAHVA